MIDREVLALALANSDPTDLFMDITAYYYDPALIKDGLTSRDVGLRLTDAGLVHVIAKRYDALVKP